MNKIQKKLDEALTGRFKLAAALQKREQERKAKDEARAAREKQQQPVKTNEAEICSVCDTDPCICETGNHINEISDKTLQSYRQRAHTQIQHYKLAGGKDKPEAAKVLAKREPGMATATSKVIQKEKERMATQPKREPQKTTPYKPLGGRDEVSGRSYSESVVGEAAGTKPGWMLKQDPVLAKKVADAQKLAKKRQATYGDPSKGISVKEDTFKQFRASLVEKTLTPAEKKKREEVAKAIERENPNMPMGMKMAIATKTAKRVAEDTDQIDELTNKTLISYMSKVNDDLAKHKMDPTKRSAEKRNKSVSGFATAYNKTQNKFKNVKEEVELEEARGLADMSMDQLKQEHEKVKSKIESEGKSKMISMNHPLSQRARSIRLHMLIKQKKQTSEETVIETKSAPKGFHFTKDGKLKRGDANQDGDGGPMLRSDPLDKQRNKIPAVSEELESQHYCAKHVRSQLLGDGVVLEAHHADPDEQGNVEWYMVEFKDGIRKVYTEDLEIMLAEYHGNHKKKKMTNG